MSILDDYKQLQMIENVKKIKEMELCYKSNLKLCKQQEKQINKLATAIEKIKEMLIKTPTDSREHFLNAKSVILQICDEVNDANI